MYGFSIRYYSFFYLFFSLNSYIRRNGYNGHPYSKRSPRRPQSLLTNSILLSCFYLHKNTHRIYAVFKLQE